MSSDEIKVIKSPNVSLRENGEDFMEHAYRGRIIYYVRLSNGLIATKPDDFFNEVEAKE